MIITPRLAWFSHRLSDPDPRRQAHNLADARYRFDEFSATYHVRGIKLIGPWMDVAECDVPEAKLWAFIEAGIALCSLLVLDLDGGDGTMSTGLRRERGIADRLGDITCGLVGSEDYYETRQGDEHRTCRARREGYAAAIADVVAWMRLTYGVGMPMSGPFERIADAIERGAAKDAAKGGG